eukprot:TRINITY_DN71880_c0_g1_i1.p1 TRINITY_DN71880_c0_g1~~TRINITY_DN71880_c0_g1_i1.p1  ORF type:complete len:476 (-),score=82.19 TRINITY_DN71880_c0_g1_i1:214-1545(-)
MAASSQDMLNLPEREFTYLAGSTDRPWEHFVGRWRCIRPVLAEILNRCAGATDKPLRVVDVGSCTGFFSLQAAHQHPEADVVGIEGSVGIGNGGEGRQGSTRAILRTSAVQTHLRWIRRTRMENCFVAPEVWDYDHVCKLASLGRPICDAMFLFSVIHHIDGVSHDQYARAGLTRLQGFIDLLAKILKLSSHHFIELPNDPWLQPAYNAYQTQRGILSAGAKASGIDWIFRGPIYKAEWFGVRELWVLEAPSGAMAPVDVRDCQFPLLYRGDEPELFDDSEQAVEADDDNVSSRFYDGASDVPKSWQGLAPGNATDLETASRLLPLQGHDLLAEAERKAAFQRAQCGLMIDPGLLTSGVGQSAHKASERTGRALASAPTELLLAHLALRDACDEAQRVLKAVQLKEPTPQQQQQRYSQYDGAGGAMAHRGGGGMPGRGRLVYA